MKISRYSVVVLVVSVVAMLAVACGGASSSSRRLADSADSLSYVIGMNIAYNIMQMDSTLRPEMVMAGVEDAMLGQEKISLEDGKLYLLSYMNYDVYERVSKYEDQYLTDLAASDASINRTRTGLTYKVGELGNMSNTANHPRDTVAFTYTVRTMAGVEVDPASERPDTLRTTLMKLPDGLSEGVKLVGQGGKVTLWIPSKLAYGPAGDSEKGIKPNEMLQYEVQIVEVKRRRR
ncbi:MAG: FKBP-type peptidyl-prolyl cis-trans isomerase [Alistipes sp.]|nr:FKBP-type peptidyl-prolyl cis-trans isomerase [Alistipes sp.]